MVIGTRYKNLKYYHFLTVPKLGLAAIYEIEFGTLAFGRRRKKKPDILLSKYRCYYSIIIKCCISNLENHWHIILS